MSERTLGYVVIEWNQVSHEPELVHYPALCRTLDEALTEVEAQEARTRQVGRRERYTVAAVVEEFADE